MALVDSVKRMMSGARSGWTPLGASTLPIAIDFGAGALKILQVHPAGADEPPTFVGAACLPTPDELISNPAERLAFQLEALPKLMRSADFKGKRAVCAIPAALAFCKHMQFQVEAGVQVSQLVRAAVPAQIGCDPNALVFRHVEVGPIARTNKTEVICLAAGRELVDRLMRAVKECKLDPVGMHVEYSAVLRCFDSITRREDDKNTTSLYLDIGAGSTKIIISHGTSMVFARAIELGGRHLDAAVAKQLGVALADARKHRLAMADLRGKGQIPPPDPRACASKGNAAASNNGKPDVGCRTSDGADPAVAPAALGTCSPAGPAPTPVGRAAPSPICRIPQLPLNPDRRQGALPTGFTGDLTVHPSMDFQPHKADLTEPLEILTDEVSMCLRYHESVFPGRKVDRAIFFGGEARHLGLCQHIARALRVPAQVADPMAGIAGAKTAHTPGVDFNHPQPGWAMTLGLCLSPTDL